MRYEFRHKVYNYITNARRPDVKKTRTCSSNLLHVFADTRFEYNFCLWFRLVRLSIELRSGLDRRVMRLQCVNKMYLGSNFAAVRCKIHLHMHECVSCSLCSLFIWFRVCPRHSMPAQLVAHLCRTRRASA